MMNAHFLPPFEAVEARGVMSVDPAGDEVLIVIATLCHLLDVAMDDAPENKQLEMRQATCLPATLGCA